MVAMVYGWQVAKVVNPKISCANTLLKDIFLPSLSCIDCECFCLEVVFAYLPVFIVFYTFEVPPKVFLSGRSGVRVTSRTGSNESGTISWLIARSHFSFMGE